MIVKANNCDVMEHADVLDICTKVAVIHEAVIADAVTLDIVIAFAVIADRRCYVK